MGYNVNGEIASLNWVYTTDPSIQPWNIQYTYSSTQNNGQITQMVDGISGETVSYSYDSLKRLTSASSTPTAGSSSTAWTQAYGYDGFGNMRSKTLNGGGNSAPAVDPTTNRLTSGYDANGNMLTGYGLTMTYDGRNRVASATPTYSGTEYYGYAPDNKRIYRWNPTTGTEEWTFYGAKGERIGSFGLNTSATYYSGTYYFYATETNVWFAGQLISNANGFVLRDRLGTDRETGARYYPYGDEITSTANGMEKYGTYFRDSFTALDYADQRYYVGAYGRFNTTDQGGVHLKDPGSWNRYAYVGGDPINFNDRRGLSRCDPNAVDDDGSDDDCGDDGGDGIGGGSGGPVFTVTVTTTGLPDPSPCVGDLTGAWGGSSSGAPSAAQGGGSGAAGAPAVLSSFSFAQLQTQATAALNYELNNLGPNCDKVLPVGTLKSVESFTPLTFWNATTQGGQLASLLGGTNGGANATIGSYFGNGQYAVILNGAGGGFINQVVLGANFYSDPSSQGLTLLHELLHFALQKGDAGIDAHFGINVGVAGASASFSKWLANDCNN